MATVELIKNQNEYSVDVITWAPIQLITDMGIAQLKVYFSVDNGETWIELFKSSWQSSYNSASQTISLENAAYDLNGSAVPANINPAIHKIKIKRVTSPSLYIKFQDGAKLSGRDLNIVNLQSIHLLEEEAARLDTADANIYTYINTTLNDYYTKTEIDGFFDAQTLIAAWTSGESYLEGDVVLADDPLVSGNDIQIWYCIQDHVASSSNQPSTIGTGSSFWSLSQNDTILDQLNYIRRMPGVSTSQNAWNTIQIQDVNAFGLRIFPKTGQQVDLFNILFPNKNPALQFTGDNRFILNQGATLWAKDNSFFSGSNWLNYTPDSSRSGTPALSIKNKPGGNAIEVVKSSASNNTSNVLFKIDDTSIFTGASRFYIDGGVVEFINKLVWFSGTETENCYGLTSVDLEGNPPFSEVRFGRDASFGTLASCMSEFVTKLTLSAATGNIITQGNITTAATLKALDVVVDNAISADYLATDSTGRVVAGSGTPLTSRLAVPVTNSNTSLANRDVVYLDNNTGLWTKSRANDKFTLAVGIVDGLSGTAPNQSFSVVFSGLVSGYTGLEIGNWYWLSKTNAGEITSTRPDTPGDLVDPVGIAISSTALFVITARAHKLPTATPSGILPGGSGDVGTDVIWDNKGDLAVGTGANSAERLPVGTNGQYLVADSTTSLGVRWASLTSSFDFGTVTLPADFSLDLGGI